MPWVARLICAFSGFLLTAGAAGETVRYIHTDALGSVVAVSDETGNVIERREYEPFGAQLTPAIADGPGYTGHVQDAATGLTYMQQRYYDSEIGRFLSVDPVSAHGGDQRHFNRYAYAYNSPYKFRDPDGRCPVCAPIITGIYLFLTSDNANAPGPSDAPSSMPAGEQIANAVPGGKVASGIRMAAKASDKTYTTYTRQKEDGTVYSGRTSGKGAPEAQVSARTSKPDHQARSAEGYGPAQVDKNSPNKDAIRGREQQLIDQNGGAQSQGGTSGNKINSVSPTNADRQQYQKSCDKEFGC
jgi:RHS repeat-associated protein